MPRISKDNYDTVASWNGSQDLFVVEQPDGTKVATPEQVKQYVLNDMDEVPTQNSNNPVKSGGIFSTMAGLTANSLTGIDISAYNSAANQYTAPTDGYVRFELRNANQYFYLNVNNAILLGGEGHQVANAYDYMSIFVRKGMKLYYNGTVQTAVFYSLV